MYIAKLLLKNFTIDKLLLRHSVGVLEYFFFDMVGVVERFGNLEPLGRALSPDHIEDHLATIRADLEGWLIIFIFRPVRSKKFLNCQETKLSKRNCDS